ncbi:hypothetical protein FQN54_008619 [Arachnomyces sp. PD_36]|nr:hypothetical protein FQN54_008619 [Arachnomyces sp. PD_36]
MEVWSGTIGSTQNTLRGVKLVNAIPEATCPLSKNAKLSLHSFVNPNLIPLCGRAGGSLEVHISDLATSQWLKTRLLSGLLLGRDDDTEECVQQCPIGVLVSVKASRNITDLLVYGILSPRATISSCPQSPPSLPLPGESPEPESHDTTRGWELRIHAIPLNSENITNARALATPPASPPSQESLDKGGRTARFLSPPRPLSPKRKRVSTLFEAATQHHRQVRRKGGEAVSQMMAGGNRRTEAPRLERGIKREASDLKLSDIKDFKKDTSNPDSLLMRGHERGRSISMGSERLATTPFGPRPSSSRGQTPSNDNPKSQLRKDPRASFTDTRSIRSITTPPPALPPPSLAAETDAPAGSPSKIIAENKDLLTRTIMTCMRLYGYHRNANTKQQRRSSTPHSRSSSFSGTATAVAASTDDEEYKSMYHATYRASTFALRRYLNPTASEHKSSGSGPVPRLERDKAMTMIDEFLKLFCQEGS